MKRIRLRWRLALSHALLAILLVIFAGQRIEAQSKVAARANAAAITERDADVLAISAARVFDNKPTLDDLVTDEETGSRKAQVIGVDRIAIAGSDLEHTRAGSDAVSKALRLSAPATSLGNNDTVVVASPIVVNANIVGIALVSEQIPGHAPGLSSFGVFNWLGVLIVVIAALAGWFLASIHRSAC